jgi:hypothetical protein
MTREELDFLGIGSVLFWNDPDGGKCSRLYTLKQPPKDNNAEHVHLIDVDGSEVDAYLDELTYVQPLSVLQPWVHTLSLMMQSVLLASVRGPDGLHKDHIAKVLIRWLRRSFLLSAFEKRAMLSPSEPGGGSFTGPITQAHLPHKHPFVLYVGDPESNAYAMLNEALTEYLRRVDEIPHHFQLHFMHAAGILGYKHPTPRIRVWWLYCYKRLVNDMHLLPESEETLDKRLGDDETSWRAAEEVTAK